MTGIIIVNMGGAKSADELKVFLTKMFNDKRILPVPSVLRKIIAKIITNKRYKGSWEKYEMIGGTPIIDDVKNLAQDLQNILGENFKVKHAFSYSQPFISQAVDSFAADKISEIKLLSLYPHTAYTTTGSIDDELNLYRKKNKSIKITHINGFYEMPEFIDYQTTIIKAHIEKNKIENPILLFSSHAIPQNDLRKGDTYPKQIRNNAKIISKKLNLEYQVSFQSKIGKVKWVGPDTIKHLSTIDKNRNIVIFPLSFINENLETLYDIDTEIIPYAKNKLRIKNISRVKISENTNLLLNSLVKLIKN